MKSSPQTPRAPIPGANYTTDTRNYPWHRPPDITDMDKVIEYVTKDLNDGPDGYRYMSMLGAGIPITMVTDFIVTKGVGRGKWAPDLAILSAGPIARLLMIMARTYKIEFDIGTDEEISVTSAQTLRELSGDPTLTLTKVEDTAEEETDEGFMAIAPDEEQNSMLGYDEDTEELEDE
tara:strand:- start:832 stop:1362 length:531 start_codon:yes stop_codon:yes gene_type:complete